jgi:hypothetical protein
MKKRFAFIPASAARAHELGATAQVYIVITGHADGSRHAFPSIRSIAEETGLHRRTVQRAITTLAAAGLIEIEMRLDHAGDSDTNLYTVLADPGGAADLPPPSGSLSATGAADLPPRVVAHRATQTDHLNRPLNTARTPARDGSRRSYRDDGKRSGDQAASLACGDDRLARARLALFEKDGTWPPEWGDRPAHHLAVAA